MCRSFDLKEVGTQTVQKELNTRHAWLEPDLGTQSCQTVKARAARKAQKLARRSHAFIEDDCKRCMQSLELQRYTVCNPLEGANLRWSERFETRKVASVSFGTNVRSHARNAHCSGSRQVEAGTMHRRATRPLPQNQPHARQNQHQTQLMDLVHKRHAISGNLTARQAFAIHSAAWP